MKRLMMLVGGVAAWVLVPRMFVPRRRRRRARRRPLEQGFAPLARDDEPERRRGVTVAPPDVGAARVPERARLRGQVGGFAGPFASPGLGVDDAPPAVSGYLDRDDED